MRSMFRKLTTWILIAPLVFATVVSGIAGMGDAFGFAFRGRSASAIASTPRMGVQWALSSRAHSRCWACRRSRASGCRVSG